MSAKIQLLPWTEEVRQTDSPQRARFLESHLELVRYLALRISGRVPTSIEIDDLTHDGVLGLLDAVERFDPSREILFRTYAETRIRGAILDGLRQRDWRPRSVRQLERSLDKALAGLAGRLRRAPTEEEIAGALGMNVEDYRATLTQLRTGPQLSLDELTAGVEPTIADTLPNPDQPLERRELIETLAEEVTRLPERERHVLELYYAEGMNMKEAGAILGVTESRVCQLHAQAAARLRVALNIRLHARPVAAEAVGARG